MENMTKAEAMTKFMLAKKRKQEMVAKIEKHLKEAYLKENGVPSTNTFTM